MPSPAASAPKDRVWTRFARTFLRRPTLIILVYSLCLVLVGITASAQAGVITLQYQQTALDSVVGDDAGLVRAVVNLNVHAKDLPPEGPSDEFRVDMTDTLNALLARSGMVRVELSDAQGVEVVASGTLDGWVPADPGPMLAALWTRTASAALVEPSVTDGGDGAATPALIREELPLVDGDQAVKGVVTVWRDAQGILATIDEMRREVVLLTVSAALVLAVVLTFIFHTAQVRIHRQTSALVEASRRDPVTGLLNHGALVEVLGSALHDAQADDQPVVVGLVDIDNFRMINATHGHDAGDEALVEIAGCIRDAVPVGFELGRYGPDELLVFGVGTAADLEPMLHEARLAVAGIDLRRVDGDAIPVTFSAGLAESPADAPGITELLAAAAQTLGAAKASGGDAIRTTAIDGEASRSRTFDVFQGLVIAIDTKDRYTKHHSEDVARYGLFIAEVMGLDAETTRALRVAGLLHDVGKIGIPDSILRRPSRLTAEETAIVQQHVALGDMIVRDLPDIDLVRAGVRHHHERWDGKGYLDRLAGEEIPLIARVLAVGDAFSAMTTTRPYRKAMSAREALIRLTDAAGTQLDEAIVLAFVSAMERHPSAPLPGSPAASLWLPRAIGDGQVAA
jgi:diguanylate cyclase (GGDEF)-like protein